MQWKASMIEGTVERCSRCAGCGRVVGLGREERGWAEFRDVPPHLALSRILGMRNPRTCPNCAGSGRTAFPAPVMEEVRV